jgi:hypothetical protein
MPKKCADVKVHLVGSQRSPIAASKWEEAAIAGIVAERWT